MLREAADEAVYWWLTRTAGFHIACQWRMWMLWRRSGEPINEVARRIGKRGRDLLRWLSADYENLDVRQLALFAFALDADVDFRAVRRREPWC